MPKKKKCIYCEGKHADWECPIIWRTAADILASEPSGKASQADIAKMIDNTIKDVLDRAISELAETVIDRMIENMEFSPERIREQLTKKEIE